MQTKPDSIPGAVATAMIEELSHYVIADVQPVVVDLARSEGMWLATVDGQKIFDWAGYYASKLLGHNHPGLYEPDYLRRLARAALPPLSGAHLARTGAASPVANGQPEEILTRHQPMRRPTGPHLGLTCQFLQPGSPMSSL